GLPGALGGPPVRPGLPAAGGGDRPLGGGPHLGLDRGGAPSGAGSGRGDGDEPGNGPPGHHPRHHRDHDRRRAGCGPPASPGAGHADFPHGGGGAGGSAGGHGPGPAPSPAPGSGGGVAPAAPTSRAITSRRISEVPSPISINRASRQYRSTTPSRV